MFLFKFDLFTVISLIFLMRYSDTQRRIVGGLPVTKDRPYVAYLVEAKTYPMYHNKWLCGGAIVSSSYILTSAACIKDVDYCYAIAGYRYYVSPYDIDSDNCTSRMKKKIVEACVPKSFPSQNKTDLNVDKWTYNDIALAKVDKPFNFTDTSYTTFCSYLPTVLTVNYDIKYEESGATANVYGWGHVQQFGEDDTYDNVKDLHYAAVKIINKEVCKKHYKDHETRLPGLENFMICTYGGDEKVHNSSTMDIGICQNDHGGPLVDETGVEDVLIGIASHYRVSKEDNTCIGPFLFTSTARNVDFLKCILSGQFIGRQELCNKSEIKVMKKNLAPQVRSGGRVRRTVHEA